MKIPIAQKLSLLFLLLFAFPASTFAASKTVSPKPAMTLGDKLGVGADQLDYFGTSPSLRYWLTDQTALDVIGNNEGYSGGAAVGLTLNIAHPSRDFYIQALGRVSCVFVHNDYYYYPNTNFYSLTGGIGFEAFLPFCESLSLSGWIGMEALDTSIPGISWVDIKTLTGSLGSPMSLGLHFYF
jgi:hypothetical protein